jgi:hypothetical protein
MIAMTAAGTPAHRRAGKMLQLTRRHVLRWFRPPEAEVRRRRLSPHPFPRNDETAAAPPQETPRDQHA